MRAYQVVTEANIADTISTYVKHQSMTVTEEQLTKTLIRMSCPGRNNDYINIVIDFSSRSICNTHQAGDGEPIEGPRCVHGPEAWLEGLRQKGWTLATILIILLAAHRCDTTASLLGQGDNQVIVLRIPSQRYVQERKLPPDEYTKQFLRVLEDICTASGIVIKVPESWRSRRLLEYGRRYYLDGV
ncbi:unnamed protein product [Parnassius apollo]|uniref:(apollo) hypothetical protein n=1 Tax=Parnassius apollo TaxID=110799 RepID=A0A8S3X768_PARAO|nr:unnamed protein product [Parnassius apollo]